MSLWDGLRTHLSFNSIRVVGKCIQNLISTWLISFTYFSKIVRFFSSLIFDICLMILHFCFPHHVHRPWHYFQTSYQICPLLVTQAVVSLCWFAFIWTFLSAVQWTMATLLHVQNYIWLEFFQFGVFPPSQM